MQALERLSKKSVFTMLTLPRGSAHKILTNSAFFSTFFSA